MRGRCSQTSMMTSQKQPSTSTCMGKCMVLPPASNKCYIYANVSENRSFLLLNTTVKFLRINRIFWSLLCRGRVSLNLSYGRKRVANFVRQFVSASFGGFNQVVWNRGFCHYVSVLLTTMPKGKELIDNQKARAYRWSIGHEICKTTRGCLQQRAVLDSANKFPELVITRYNRFLQN